MADLQVLPVAIEDEMRSSFIDYAMSVIISRAIPDVRDGLKPVHRRILYAMYHEGLLHNRGYTKCAGIVGEVLKKYHPHGDAAVYDALVRLAQPWNVRYLLVDGQGNFGSVDGDPAAAYRYTEARMTKLAEEILADIEKETVDFVPNFDGRELEPSVLPSKIPQLLVNGASGIAVGMATNIPPHNLREICDAAIVVARNPTITTDELLAIVPGPDFPTAGFILGRSGIRQAYETGRGQIIMRARTNREELKGNREAIIVTEIPYQVNKAKLVEKIAELVRDKRMEGISDLRDESDRDGMRVVIELKRDAVAEVVLNKLYKMTPLQETFGVQMLAIVDGRPKLLSLREALLRFVEHRRVVVTRRSTFELREAEKQRHLLEGLCIALDHLDEVIALIRAAPDSEAAKAGLISHFGLSEIQAKAILDMRLGRLVALERDKILLELKETLATVERLQTLLADEGRILQIVVQELEVIRDEYSDARRTEILEEAGDISVEDMIADEDMVVTVTHSGYIKRNPVSLYRAQRRGGRGITGAGTTDEDFVTQLFVAGAKSHILLFTNMGRVYATRVFEVPQAGRAARGKALVNLVELKPEERVVRILPVREFKQGQSVFFVTRRGTVKKTDLLEFEGIRRTGIVAVLIDDNDSLIDAQLTEGQKHILLATRGGMAIRFDEQDARPMGRSARGVIGIRLEDGDEVVSLAVIDAESQAAMLTVCEHGFGKRTDAAEYRAQNRGGSGIITIKTTDRNGSVVSLRTVEPDDHLMLITDRGVIIRMPVRGISVVGRNTQGVRLVRLEDGQKVAAVERLAEREEEDEDDVTIPTSNGSGNGHGPS